MCLTANEGLVEDNDRDPEAFLWVDGLYAGCAVAYTNVCVY